MASICRLCLNEEAKLIDLFSDEESSERIQKIYEISNILITPEPGCPNGVCLNCNRQLEISWTFRKQIQNSHIIITDTLKISIEPSCGDEIVLAKNLDKVESDGSDKEIGVDIVAPDGEDGFFEIAEIESEGDKSSEMPIKEEICDAPISESQPINDIDESTKLSDSSGETDNRLQCEMCNREYRSKSAYATHMLLQACVKRMHKCNKCGRRFFELDKLKMHKRIHTAKRFKCSHCGKLFLQQSDLNVHKQRHTIMDGMKFKCLKCPKQFNLVTERNEHLQSHHNVSLVKCDQCDYVTVKMYLMKVHMRKHTGEKPYECAICPKTFSRLSNFKKHVRTHTGDKPYSCSYCDLRFVQRKGMIMHENRYHSEEIKIE